MHLMPEELNTGISCSFLNSVPLSCKINLEQEVLSRISLMYDIEMSSAILLFSGTVIRYEVSMHMNIRACLLPFDVAGNGPINSMTHPAKGTFGISKCIDVVYNQLGRKCIHNWQLCMC